MLKFINKFRRDEDGAVTVDWVVLTAAIVALGIAVFAAVGPNIQGMANAIGTEVGTADDSIGEASEGISIGDGT